MSVSMSAVALSLVILNLGGGEIILILALLLILFGSRRFPDIGRGLRLWLHEFRKVTRDVRGEVLRLWRREFRKVTRDVRDEVDGAAHAAGESLGGIYGKPAAEALTPDNKVAELYDPAAFQERAGDDGRPNVARVSLSRRLWLRVRALFVPRG